jgi:hypothetical protein
MGFSHYCWSSLLPEVDLSCFSTFAIGILFGYISLACSLSSSLQGNSLCLSCSASKRNEKMLAEDEEKEARKLYPACSLSSSFFLLLHVSRENDKASDKATKTQQEKDKVKEARMISFLSFPSSRRPTKRFSLMILIPHASFTKLFDSIKKPGF